MVIRADVESAVLEEIAERANLPVAEVRERLATRPQLTLKDLDILPQRVLGLVNRLRSIARQYEGATAVPSGVVTLASTVNACIELTYRCANGEGS